MKKILKNTLVILLVCFLVATLIFSYRTKVAIQIATEYLNNKYEQQMTYSSFRYSLIDPSIYHITFKSQKSPNISFKVYVQNDLTLLTSVCDSDGFYISADNYYLEYFKYNMCNYLGKYIVDIWGSSSKFNSLMEEGAYGFNISPLLNEDMPFLEMIDIIDGYNHYIDIEKIFEQESIHQEASSIFKFCEILKENGYHPNNIFINYRNKQFSIEYHSNLTFEDVCDLLQN